MDDSLHQRGVAEAAILQQRLTVAVIFTGVSLAVTLAGVPLLLILPVWAATVGIAAYVAMIHRRFWQAAAKVGIDPRALYKEALPTRRELLRGGIGRLISGQPGRRPQPPTKPGN